MYHENTTKNRQNVTYKKNEEQQQHKHNILTNQHVTQVAGGEVEKCPAVGERQWLEGRLKMSTSRNGSRRRRDKGQSPYMVGKCLKMEWGMDGE